CALPNSGTPFALVGDVVTSMSPGVNAHRGWRRACPPVVADGCYQELVYAATSFDLRCARAPHGGGRGGRASQPRQPNRCPVDLSECWVPRDGDQRRRRVRRAISARWAWEQPERSGTGLWRA